MQNQLELTPEDEANLDAEREAHLVAYRRKYWQQYKSRHGRVYGTLTKTEFAEIKAIAKYNGRSVWDQIWIESCAYRSQKFLPPKEIEDQIHRLYSELRRAGNNLNQIARHYNKGRVHHPMLLDASHTLEKLEEAVSQFVSRPWRRK